jgi:serine/threonine protein kinase
MILRDAIRLGTWGAVLEELQDGDPRRIGKYVLLGRLGSGGMGEVFLGRSLAGRLVAVKVIHSMLARDRDFRARFAREVVAARLVSGAFTAPVIDADPEAALPWLATSYIAGPSLAQAVGEHGPLPVPAVLALAAGLAEGLSAVHEAGVIHRDLKPSNVLLAHDGPRLIDFGISQAADFSHVTLTGMVVGTPGFMSPEQALGDQVGPPSDIFSLGAVLVFAATGEGPYGTGSPVARQMRAVNFAPRLDEVPAELRPLIERCLAQDPADRPAASQFLADLVAAHPEAGDQTDWSLAVARSGNATQPPAAASEEAVAPSPGWELTVTATTPPEQKAPDPESPSRTPQPSFIPKAVGGSPEEHRPPRKRRRRPWIIAAAAVAAGTAAAVVIAIPSTPPVLQPAGLTASQLMPQSVEIAWSGPTSGPLPGQYEIMRNGQEVALVAGTKTDYSATGLNPGTAYQFSVRAIRGSGRSPVSSTLAVTTTDPAPAQPARLTVSGRTPQSVELVWSGPAAGLVPDGYEIIRDGDVAASVPGSTTNYKDTGLDPGTTYHFSVIAVRDGKKSPPSRTITVKTITPSLSDALLLWTGGVGSKVTVANTPNYNYWHAGQTWTDDWTFNPECPSGACRVELDGDIDGINFNNLSLSPRGADYSGSVALDKVWSCATSSNHTDSTLHIKLTIKSASGAAGVWTAQSFAGVVTWDIDYNPNGGCLAFNYQMKVQGTD